MTRKPSTPPANPAAAMVPLADLRPWVKNPRKNDHAVQAVADSIARFGFASPILARKADGRVIAGHTRIKAAIRLGLAEVPVRYLDLDDEQADALALADNRLGEIAEWDDAALAEILSGLGEASKGLGWSDDEIAALVQDAAPEPVGDPDDAPAVQPDAVSKAGEVYALGPHRLVCGDSTTAEAWAAALGQDRPALVLTDPPYGLGGVKESAKNDYATFDDSADNVRRMAGLWLPLAIERAPAVVFSPGITGMGWYPPPAWVLCWHYGGGQQYSPWGFNCWQPFLAYGKDPSLAGGHGCRPDAVSLNVPANAAELGHPCPKPVALWAWLIERLSFDRADIIADCFGGSGTTIIAAAMTGRIARVIEYDPRYCDVIRRRWTRWARENGQDPGPGALDG